MEKNGSNTCQSCFIVDIKFSGNLCGDYGVDVMIHNNSFPICYPQQYYKLTLQTMDKFSLHLWYTDDNGMFNMSCQLWVSENNYFRRSMHSANSSLISLDKRQSYELMAFHDQLAKQSPVFSLDANTVQRINFDWNNDICNNGNNVCLKEANVAWLSHQSCQFNLVCPVIKGDICSLAGLQLSYEHQNTSICLENWTYQKSLSAHNVLTLNFWQTPLANFEMDCFAWCSTNSQNSFSLFEDEFRTLHINTNETKADFCKDNLCVLKHEFHWTRPGTCLATFRCSRLEGLPCEAYTLNVTFPETGMLESFNSVCIANAVILGTNIHDTHRDYQNIFFYYFIN